ncbi:hypothetical protein MHLP_02430 [Candidatus Mycoplasma haematolamae str. Purdue]|uniref:Uncharacterized protein n=1 Tax=Mycoplasma haematolamae (strain Purdue) TaxID=1212765 RepID=I7CFS2_MYCHA|nr:hypothetical protein [Candidatus Mycoplasma haematolamae]AFO52066.1 hypothetical protein MHLP_02430 [Candidatus Mycoplasma haematolamae str. Purdue]
MSLLPFKVARYLLGTGSVLGLSGFGAKHLIESEISRKEINDCYANPSQTSCLNSSTFVKSLERNKEITKQQDWPKYKETFEKLLAL